MEGTKNTAAPKSKNIMDAASFHSNTGLEYSLRKKVLSLFIEKRKLIEYAVSKIEKPEFVILNAVKNLNVALSANLAAVDQLAS